MSQIISVPNFKPSNILEETALSADCAAAQKVLTVASNQNITADDYLLVGRQGGEKTELVQVDTITGVTTITAEANLGYAHQMYDQVYRLFGNQIKIYRAANVDGTPPADASFAALGSPFDIDPDEMQTGYVDSTGGDGYWYKFIYWNSTTSTGTPLADATPIRGTGANNLTYCSLDDIRGEAGLRGNPYITDTEVDQARRSAQQLVDSRLNGIYTLPFTAPIHPTITLIVKTYAAGLLLVKDYGPVNTLNTNEGNQKLELVTNAKHTGWLDKLDDGTSKLIGVDGVSMAIPGSVAGANGWPNADTAEADVADGGAPRAFRMGDLSGYDTRVY